MSHVKIQIKVDNHIGIITLNRPEKHNALDADMVSTLTQTYLDLNQDTKIQCIVLQGNGKHFCAGADLTHMKTMATVPFEENLRDAKTLATLFYTIYACDKPTLCCVQGKTFGGGLGLIAASDIAIATHTAQFCFSEVKIGLVPATIAPFVVQRIGYQAAKTVMLTAESFDADKAQTIQLIDRVSDEPLAHAQKIAMVLQENHAIAMSATKKWLNTLKPITQSTLNQAAEMLAKMRG